MSKNHQLLISEGSGEEVAYMGAIFTAPEELDLEIIFPKKHRSEPANR